MEKKTSTAVGEQDMSRYARVVSRNYTKNRKRIAVSELMWTIEDKGAADDQVGEWRLLQGIALGGSSTESQTWWARKESDKTRKLT